MKVILLGGNGQLGKEFKSFLMGIKNVELFSYEHSELDILNLNLLREAIRSIKPFAVINCAAYTKVDLAEDEKDEAYRVNTIGAKNVSLASGIVGAKAVYFSTDYVFDGAKGSTYSELDFPNPISVYGNSKYFGEIMTQLYNPNHLILRISWLYGVYGNNFVKTIINKAKNGEKLRIVSDQKGTPTYAYDVTRQTWKLLQENQVGLFHSVNEGETTWFEFALKVLRLLKMDAEISAINTEEFPAKALRPKYSVLRNYFLDLAGLNLMRKWEEALFDFVSMYKEDLVNG